jgi:hypothetical protein
MGKMEKLSETPRNSQKLSETMSVKINELKLYSQISNRASTPTGLFADTLLWWKGGELQTTHYTGKHVKIPELLIKTISRTCVQSLHTNSTFAGTLLWWKGGELQTNNTNPLLSLLPHYIIICLLFHDQSHN